MGPFSPLASFVVERVVTPLQGLFPNHSPDLFQTISSYSSEFFSHIRETCATVFSEIPFVGRLTGRLDKLDWRVHIIHAGLIITIVLFASALFQGSLFIGGLSLFVTIPLLFASYYVNQYQELLRLEKQLSELEEETEKLSELNKDLKENLERLSKTNGDLKETLARLQTTVEKFESNEARLAFVTEELKNVEPKLKEAVENFILTQARTAEETRNLTFLQEQFQKTLAEYNALLAQYQFLQGLLQKQIEGVREDVRRAISQQLATAQQFPPETS